MDSRLSLKWFWSGNTLMASHPEAHGSEGLFDLSDNPALQPSQEIRDAIEALPELLDACDFALVILEGMGNGNGDAANACRTASAKARGEENG